MKTTEAAALYRLMQEFSKMLDREAPITQALVFLRVGMAGNVGLDQGRLTDELRISSAGTSRTVQALSNVHYLKDRPGYGLVERVFDPTDNRKRELRLTIKGQRAIANLADLWKGG